MAPPREPKRLVICVDDRPGRLQQQTSIQRIHLAVRAGQTGDRYFTQLAKYISGDDSLSTTNLQSSVLGQRYLQDVEEVYRQCCELNDDKDEVWFFGFGRGAYVVRAVAGLLHDFGALQSGDRLDFAKDFKKLLRECEAASARRSSVSLTPTSSLMANSSRRGPRIRFLGAFDTIKAGRGDSVFNISFNPSISNMRHAMALHEPRLTVESLHPDVLISTDISEAKRTFVEAWFTGTHADIGGCAKRAGLALYPLQWMLLEARKCGLDLDIANGWLGSPAAAILPHAHKKGAQPWSCTAANGIDITLYDFRHVHREYPDFAVKLASTLNLPTWKQRAAFTEKGHLNGYIDFASQGCIIHPSVYLLLDENITISLQNSELKLLRHLTDWRERMLGSQQGVINTGFWSDDFDDAVPEPGAVRVLVCGNTGVGKSTLINKVFGVDVTQSSNRSRGIHDCREEITFEGRPDLVVHDSGGFEAGADEEFVAIESFLKEKAGAIDVADRLHVIWFCIDINSSRTLQTATEKLFKAVSEYAADVPIVVVATKKDDFLDIEFGACRKQMKRDGKRFDEEACEQYAAEKLRERIAVIRQEMQSVPGGRLDACVAVSQDDPESIADLSKTTSRCFDTDKVRLLYVRAQVSRIDLKIEIALAEMMRRYRILIRSATGSSFAPFGASISRQVSTSNVVKAIINCFGLPMMSTQSALRAMKDSVWSSHSNNAIMGLAESFHLVGVAGSAFLAGIPVWILTGAINSSYLVPATCRIFLIMACDLVFVLARSFKEVTFRAGGMPSERDVGAAARNYQVRGYVQHIHREVKALVPRKNVLASFKADAVKQGVDDIFARYKDKLMEDVDLPLKIGNVHIESPPVTEDDRSTINSLATTDTLDTDESLYTDVQEARAALAELDSTERIAELDDYRNVTELPAAAKPVELDAVGNAKTELPA